MDSSLLPKQPPTKVFLFELDIADIEKENSFLQEEPVASWYRAVVTKLKAHLAFESGNDYAFEKAIVPFPEFPKRVSDEILEQLPKILEELKEKAQYKEVKMPKS